MKILKFLFLIVIILAVTGTSANAQNHPPQPPLYDNGYYIPQVPAHVSGPVFVNKQIPDDRYHKTLDYRKDKLWWGGKKFPWVVGLNMRYHGRVGGPSVVVHENRSTLNLMNNTEPNQDFWKDIKRKNKKEVRKNKHSKKRHKRR